MSTPTIPMSLGKAQDPDNARDYLVVVLGAALDTVAAHDHSGDANAVKRIAFGALAGRPAPGTPGFVYIATDTGALYFDDGAAWHASNDFTILKLPAGAVDQPTPAAGQIMFRSDTKQLRWYDGTTWHTSADTASAQTLLAKTLQNAVASGSAAVALAVNGASGQWSETILSANSGAQHGILIDAGHDSSDFAMLVRNRAQTVNLVQVRGDGYGALGEAGQIQWGPGNSAPTITNPQLAGTVGGTPAWASPQAFPAGTTAGGMPLPLSAPVVGTADVVLSTNVDTVICSIGLAANAMYLIEAQVEFITGTAQSEHHAALVNATTGQWLSGGAQQNVTANAQVSIKLHAIHVTGGSGGTLQLRAICDHGTTVKGADVAYTAAAATHMAAIRIG